MRRCAICSKGSIMVGTRKLLRGHYNPTNWTRKHPNLQKAKLPSGLPRGKAGESALICTKCIKKLHSKETPSFAKASPFAKATEDRSEGKPAPKAGKPAVVKVAESTKA